MKLTDEERRKAEDIILSVMYVTVGLAICTIMFAPVWMIVLLCGD